MEILEFIGSILELLSLFGSKGRDESRPLSTEERERRAKFEKAVAEMAQENRARQQKYEKALRELAHEGDNKLAQR